MQDMIEAQGGKVSKGGQLNLSSKLENFCVFECKAKIETGMHVTKHHPYLLLRWY